MALDLYSVRGLIRTTHLVTGDKSKVKIENDCVFKNTLARVKLTYDLLEVKWLLNSLIFKTIVKECWFENKKKL